MWQQSPYVLSYARQTNLRPDSREEQLVTTVKRTLEARNYPWYDNPMMLKQGTPTNSLKELLITNSVEMEATTDTNVTALCTVDTEPVESVENFERLHRFCDDCVPAHKSELSQVLFPVFVHIYLDLVAGGHSGIAESFLGKFSMVIGSTHQSEIRELGEVVSAEQVDTSSLARKFRNQTFCLRMSNKTFQLLMQFLQVCQTPGLLSMIQRHLAIEVYGNVPVSSVDNTGKTELKKGAHAQTFYKPKIPQLETKPRIITKTRTTSPRKDLKRSESTLVTSSSFGEIDREISSEFSVASHVTTSNEESGSLAIRSEFRERLAICSQQLDPSPPSLSLYTVHCPSNNSVHCAALSPTSKVYACGYADSSVHLWSQLPMATNHMTTNPPIRSHSDHHILRGHHGPVYGTSFDTNGQYLLSCSEDCTVRLWNTYSQSSIVSYRGHTYPVWDVAFSPVNVYFASSSFDKTARLWSTDLVYPLRIFAGHTASVDVVRFHRNGKYIATGSCDRTCRLWDIQSGHCVRLMAGCKSPITALAFSPNGKLLVSGDESGTVRIWDLGSGGVVKEYHQTTPTLNKKNRCQISSLTFSTDSTMLASSNHDNQISVWNMKILDQPNLSASQLSSRDIVSQYNPNTDLVLQLDFTHRNCLVAIARTVTPPPGSTNAMDIA